MSGHPTIWLDKTNFWLELSTDQPLTGCCVLTSHCAFTVHCLLTRHYFEPCCYTVFSSGTIFYVQLSHNSFKWNLYYCFHKNNQIDVSVWGKMLGKLMSQDRGLIDFQHTVKISDWHYGSNLFMLETNDQQLKNSIQLVNCILQT